MEVVSILSNVQYKEDGPAVSILMETDVAKEVRIAFKEGQLMREHTAPFPITIQIVEGEIDFGVNGQTYPMKRGDMISLTAQVPHDLKAKSTSIVRLTLSKKDKVSRVQKSV